MSLISNKDKILVKEQNISYYDEIADNYDYTLNQKASDKLAREKVKETLVSLLASGWVLDFGGGTGLDLSWLTAKGYKIIFCEPAVAMREKAIQYNERTLQYDQLYFLDSTKTDWSKWHESPPFSQKTDAILANFGVLNCIPDIDQLFAQLARVINPGGHFITLILDRSFAKMLKWHRRNAVKSLIFRSPFIMYVWHKEHRQTVYVHSVPEVQKAAGVFFECRSHASIPGTGFTLLHMVRR